MFKKYIIPSFYYVFAVFEFILGCILIYEIGIRYAKPFGIYNLLECILLFCPVLYMVFSLSQKGLYLYKISIGEFGKAYNCKSNKQFFDISSDCEEIYGLKESFLLSDVTQKNKSEQPVSVGEVIYYVLSVIIFIFGMSIALFLGFTLPDTYGFEFYTFAIALIITIYVSLSLLSKAMNKTYMRKCCKLHQLQVLFNILNNAEK